jgi:hypothetical protein
VLQVEFMVQDTAGKYILVIESRTDPEEARRRRWPHFIARLHDKYDCPVILVVVCSKGRTARWARAPIEIGARAWSARQRAWWCSGRTTCPPSPIPKKPPMT